MDTVDRFLLGSIAVMFLLYLSAMPFVQYYDGFEGLEEGTNEIKWDKALVADIQMTASAGFIIILILLLAGYRLEKRWPGLWKRL